MGKGGHWPTLTDAIAHSQKHGYELKDVPGGSAPANSDQGRSEPKNKAQALPSGPRMRKTECEYALILEAMKRRGEILEYRFEGVSLAWGEDPETGKPMRYKADFWVRRNPTFEDSEHLFERLPVTLVEVKGAHIFPKDLIRFRGCRAEWPIFKFELHQRNRDGSWHQIH